MLLLKHPGFCTMKDKEFIVYKFPSKLVYVKDKNTSLLQNLSHCGKLRICNVLYLVLSVGYKPAFTNRIQEKHISKLLIVICPLRATG